jgi:hypothetical protein
LENIAHSAGISVAPVTFIIHPLQVMIATTDTLTLEVLVEMISKYLAFMILGNGF